MSNSRQRRKERSAPPPNDENRLLAVERGVYYHVLLAYHFDRLMNLVGMLERRLANRQTKCPMPMIVVPSPGYTPEMEAQDQADLKAARKFADEIFRQLEGPARSTKEMSLRLRKFAAHHYADASFPTWSNIHDAVSFLADHLRMRNAAMEDAVAKAQWVSGLGLRLENGNWVPLTVQCAECGRNLRDTKVSNDLGTPLCMPCFREASVQCAVPGDLLIPRLRGLLQRWPDELMSPASMDWLKPAQDKDRTKKKGKYLRAAATRISEVLGVGFSRPTVENIYNKERRLRESGVGIDTTHADPQRSKGRPRFKPAPDDLHRYLLETLVPSLATTLAVSDPTMGLGRWPSAARIEPEESPDPEG